MTTHRIAVTDADDEPQPSEIRNAPWWVQAVTRYGVVAVAFGYLLYFVTHDISGRLTALQISIDRHISEQQTTRYYLRGICLNTATTENERANCLGPQSDQTH